MATIAEQEQIIFYEVSSINVLIVIDNPIFSDVVSIPMLDAGLADVCRQRSVEFSYDGGGGYAAEGIWFGVGRS